MSLEASFAAETWRHTAGITCKAASAPPLGSWPLKLALGTPEVFRFARSESSDTASFRCKFLDYTFVIARFMNKSQNATVKDSQQHTMDNLPNELILHILPFLTPDGLVFFSQTCRRFRNLIPLEKYHFMQALLALECNPNYGGPVIPQFDLQRSRMLLPG